MVVSDGEKMLIPLYHGSNMVFYSSIVKEGLGAIDPNVEFKSLQLLSELRNIDGWLWSEDPDLIVLELAVKNMVEQHITEGGFNFRHGNTYLTPSKKTAIRYAINNRFGSEILSTAIFILGKLEEHDTRIAQDIGARYPAIRSIRSIEPEPLLIEALHVPVDQLRSEKGEDPSATIQDIVRFTSGKLSEFFDDMVQQFNFECTGTISIDKLRFYNIEESRGRGETYSLRPVVT